MTTEVEHTPTTTPWFLIEHVSGAWTIQNRDGGGGDCIAQQYGNSSVANAAFIVKAVNAHAELVDKLALAVRLFRLLEKHHPNFSPSAVTMEYLESALEKANG